MEDFIWEIQDFRHLNWSDTKLSPGTPGCFLKAYEEQITSLQYKISCSRRIVSEEQDRIRNAQKELLVLWKMEINAAVTKKKDYLELASGKQDTRVAKSNGYHKAKRSAEFDAKAFIKLKKVSGGKHAAID